MFTKDVLENSFLAINEILARQTPLIDAYQELEPLILELLHSQRMSIFQRRLQHQDLVARFKTGKETKEIKVPISPAFYRWLCSPVTVATDY